MENNFLTAEDFEGRLNLSGFVNIEKGLTESEFGAKYPSDKFRVYEESMVSSFLNAAKKMVGGDIVKGGFNDNEAANNIWNNAQSEVSSLEKVRVITGVGQHKYVFVQETKEVIAKAVENDLEKSHISDAFRWDNKMMFSKTGAEIKVNMLTERNRIEDENSRIESDIESCEKEFTTIPSENPSVWGMRERVKSPYKVFNWNQTYFSNDASMKVSCSGDGSVDCQPCGSVEEAECNRKYNDLVYKWIDNCSEIILLDLYINNLDDKKSYELTAEQMVTLKF